MKLVADKVLEESSIVANCQMNRERNLSGSNGYDVELRFKPLEYLVTTIQRLGKARWLDLCCGTGKALIETAKVADTEDLPLEIVDADLAGLFLPSDSSRLKLLQASLSDWQTETTSDLITCIHGLHYIGDKLGLITRGGSWLTEHGRFVANLDMTNIRLSKGRSSSRIITHELRKAGFDYSFRTKLIRCDGRHAVHLLETARRIRPRLLLLDRERGVPGIGRSLWAVKKLPLSPSRHVPDSFSRRVSAFGPAAKPFT